MKLKNKILSIVLSAILVAAAIPFCPFNAFAFSQSDLIESIEEGYDIFLENDIYLSKTIVIPSGSQVTIDLCGKKLDRGLKDAQEGGSVLKVESGATLKIEDSTGYNSGLIKGGNAYIGGGIVNYGTLIFEGGSISDNNAVGGDGLGGGIYNAPGATATLKGGVIEFNRAKIGGGVYNAEGGTLNIQECKYEISKGAVNYTIVDNIKISNNIATETGSGFANKGTLNMKGAPVIKDNENSDLYLYSGKKINVTSSLTGQKKAKADVYVSSEVSNVEITSGFGANNAYLTVDTFFKANSGKIIKGSKSSGNLEGMIKDGTKTLVQVFEAGQLTKSEEYDNPQTAWDKAISYANSRDNREFIKELYEAMGVDPNNPYSDELMDTDMQELIEFLEEMKNAEMCRVEITLGSDWEHDNELNVKENSSICVDLNGHYIKRTRNMDQKKRGGVFYVNDGAKFVVKDSNPKSRGYDGIRGGVITGGASSNTGGAIHIGKNTVVDIQGGTFYECTTCDEGGAICMEDDGGAQGRFLTMRNCHIWFCQTIDSTDSCYGGGIYIGEDANVYLSDMTIQDCYSEDSGGGIYQKNDYTYLNMNNVLLTGNTCRDNGGAVCIKGTGGASYEPFGAYRCTFRGNKANQSGGAVYIDGEGRSRPTTISKCTFIANETGDDGAAIYVNDDNTSLDGCTITGNNAKDKGAVYVDSYYDINVQGLMTVKDNTAGDTDNKNLVLQDGAASTARVYSGGLDRGSYIAVSTTGSGKVEMSKEMAKYQIQYFHPDKGSIVYEHTKNVESKLITASLFGSGSGKIIIVMISAAVISIIAAIVVKKKIGGADDDDDDEE